ncbi:MAG: ABC transporter permease [Treponema sp.]|jgi:ribose/xylose/arabinose/galactoside ABC-type transport system permease subunit|nr:ABC transporter permease [Treponema sp.]
MAKKRLSIGYKILLTPEIGVLIPILLLVVFTSFMTPNFLTARYLTSILNACVFIGAAALAEAMVILCGEIDLSVGFAGTLSAVVFGHSAMAWGFGPVPAFLIALCTGGAVGWLNGFLIYKIGINSWITTLATQFICQGIAVTITQGLPQSIDSLGLQSFTRARPLGFSWLLFIFILMIIVLDLLVRRTRFGFKLRAVGGNADAANMAGINVRYIKWAAFVLAGILAACSGIFDTLQNNSASDTFGAGREFRAIICCAIGGISMAGGAGSIYGVGLGVLLFHVLWFCLRILGVNTNLQLVLIGFILILAVLLDLQRKRVEARKLI